MISEVLADSAMYTKVQMLHPPLVIRFGHVEVVANRANSGTTAELVMHLYFDNEQNFLRLNSLFAFQDDALFHALTYETILQHPAFLDAKKKFKQLLSTELINPRKLALNCSIHNLKLPSKIPRYGK